MGIVKSGMPSELITDFLVALVEDSNYFTAGVLWDCEIAQLDFSRLVLFHLQLLYNFTLAIHCCVTA